MTAYGDRVHLLASLWMSVTKNSGTLHFSSFILIGGDFLRFRVYSVHFVWG